MTDSGANPDVAAGLAAVELFEGNPEGRCPVVLAVETSAPMSGDPIALALHSDGLLPVSVRLSDWTPLPGSFGPLFAVATTGASATPLSLGGFLASPRINARTDDDKTFVLAVRRTTATSDRAVP